MMYTISMSFNKKPLCVAFEVDEDRLAEAKKKEAVGVDYVTTNDILTSAFFTECNSRIGMMGMDCRGRIEGVEQDHAGNYVTALTMDSEVFGTPASLREMFNGGTPYTMTKKPLPAFCRSVQRVGAWMGNRADGGEPTAMAKDGPTNSHTLTCMNTVVGFAGETAPALPWQPTGRHSATT